MALEPIQYGAYFNRAAAYDVIIPDGTTPVVSDKPEHLYGWTDPKSFGGVTHYAWKTEDSSLYYYTLLEAPVEYERKCIYTNGIMVLDRSSNYISEFDDSEDPPRILVCNEDTGDSFYMYRDINRDIDISLYAWSCTNYDLRAYTQSETPSINDCLYYYSRDYASILPVNPSDYQIDSYDSSTTPPSLRIDVLLETVLAYRDTSRDVVNTPKTVYTDSTTLTTGMILYDNIGTDTGLSVGVVNQDGSFDMATKTVTVKNLQTSELGDFELRINGVSRTVDVGESQSIEVAIGNSVSLIIGDGYAFNYVIQNSSDTAIIPNEPSDGSVSDGYVKAFTMPDHDIYFEMEFNNHGPV